MDGLESGINLDLERKTELAGVPPKTLLMAHKKTKDRYALKELNASRCNVRGRPERAADRQEACRGERPLVTLIDAFHDDDILGILMEFRDGGNPSDLLGFKRQGVKGFPLGPIALQMLHGLRHMPRA